MLLLALFLQVKLASLPLILLLLSVFQSAHATLFSFPNDSSSNLILLGDAVESHGVIELTRNTDSEALDDSSGRVLYRTPVRMVDPRTHRAASFSTSFSFKIYTVNSSYRGDGLAFLIVPDNLTVGHYGEQLGAFTLSTNDDANRHTFAVEFDTWKNSDINDPNGNHVGLDSTNISSFTYNNASNAGVQLNDGSIVTAWIDYDGTMKNLQVRISSDYVEPADPLINATVSFAGIFNEFMYVGFSASTGLSNEAHTLISWTFTSWGLPHISDSSAQATSKWRGKNAAGLAFGICLIAAFVALVAGVMSWRMLSKRGEMHFRRAKDYDPKGAPRAFTYKELYAATQGFSDKQRLGKSGSGSVFKGVLVDSGAAVAVKHIAKDPQQGLDEFLSEVKIICGLRHRNLVPLQGWCLDRGELMLVYEFMPNDSLDRFLFDTQHEVLSWAQRYTIVSGIAAALHHLHEGSEHCALHRDVKSSNVMLDNNFNTRLGDFGLARLVYHRKTSEATVFAGTFGYVAPEAVETGKATTKTDVFSFGAVALEVACGRRALESSLGPKDAVLVDWVWELHKEGRILDVADKRLQCCFDVQEMQRLLQLGLLCSHPDPMARPSMSLVYQILSGEASLPPLPSSKPMAVSSSDALHISIDELLAG